MNKRKIIALGITLLCGLLMLGGGVWAMSSDHYTINWNVIGGGGEPASSANYDAQGTIGQAVAETSTSTNYRIQSGYWHPIAAPIPNQTPNKPTEPSPADGGTVSIPVTLSVLVVDPDGDTMDVTFYNASNDSIIGVDTGVTSGSRAEVSWSGLAPDTTYSWYAKAYDGKLWSAASDTWTFTTTAEWDPWVYDTNPENGYIEIGELLDAISGYIGGDITINNLLDVISLYISHTSR